MIFRGSRLSHVRLPCFAFRQAEPLPLYSERVPVSFTTLGRCSSVSGNHGRYITRISYRNYADRAVSRPKAHTGRTTTARSKKTATATKVTLKPKPRPKPSTKAKAKAKPKAKRKPISKRKTRAKAKPAARKKILTEKQKERLATEKVKKRIRDLKATALDPPQTKIRKSVWSTIVGEVSKDPDFAKADIASRTREAVVRYNALSPERRERYNLNLIQEKADAQVAYRKWLESYTPEQIRLANGARRTLTRQGLKKYRKITDERQVARPRNAYIYFTKERQALGGYSGVAFGDTAKLIAQEWAALPAAEKKKFDDLGSQDLQRYTQELKGVYNIDVGPQRSKASATGAA